MQQLKVQFSIPCLVKVFAQMKSEVAHGPAIAIKIKHVESPRAPKWAWNHPKLPLSAVCITEFLTKASFWDQTLDLGTKRIQHWFIPLCSYFWRCNYTHYPKTRGQVNTHSKNQMLKCWWWCKGLKQCSTLSSHLILSPLKALWIFPLTSMCFRSGPEQFFKNLREIKTISFGMRLFTPLGKDCFLSKHSFHTQVTSAEFLFLPKASFFKGAGSMFLLIFHLLASKLFLLNFQKYPQLGRPGLQPKMQNILESYGHVKPLFLSGHSLQRDCPKHCSQYAPVDYFV